MCADLRCLQPVTHFYPASEHTFENSRKEARAAPVVRLGRGEGYATGIREYSNENDPSHHAGNEDRIDYLRG